MVNNGDFLRFFKKKMKKNYCGIKFACSGHYPNALDSYLKARKILNEKHSWKFSNYLPTKADYLQFMLNIHFSWHIGQLAEWRRMMAYEPALARLLDLNGSK